MHDAPYHNEPSFEADDGSGDVQRYNEKISHETLRVAVCEVLQDTMEQRAISANGVLPSVFAHVRKMYFLMCCERYLAEAARLGAQKELKDGAPFRMMAFECHSNGMAGTFQWGRTRQRLEETRDGLLKEIESWRKRGAEQTKLLREKHDAMVTSCIGHLRQEEERLKQHGGCPDGASVGASTSNAAVWEATIFGPPDSPWDGGMFVVEFVFPPDFPDSPPYICFSTPMFHPQISPSGVPFLRSVLIWHCAEPKERTILGLVHQLVALLTTAPSPEPATHLNIEAANLLFSKSDDDRKEYKKRVKRCVQRSIDG